MKKSITRTMNGKDVIIHAERLGNSVIFSAAELSHATHAWTPHPKLGRTKDDLEKEFNSAVDKFIEELTGHVETSSHLDDLFQADEDAS